MFDLPNDWVWDFWVADDGSVVPPVLPEGAAVTRRPELRHRNASVGHAVSTDLISWTRVADALDPQPAPAFDDLATWTGCVVRADEGPGGCSRPGCRAPRKAWSSGSASRGRLIC